MKAKTIIHHVIPALIDEKPEVVVIAAGGGNDLPSSKDNPCPVIDIAKYIIDT